MVWLMILLPAVLVLIAGLLILRVSDIMRDRAAWADLAGRAAKAPSAFDPAMVAALPEPARRYFNFAITPGTPLRTVATLSMKGELGLGTKDAPNYRPMQASQILAPPYGLVWRLKAGPITGSDGAVPDGSWTRFWLFHLVPVARVSASEDQRRSAFGRVVAEAAFWTPAALLPGGNVTWEARGPDTARVKVTHGDLSHWVDITVDEAGAPARVLIERWSNENPDREFRLQPFGGMLSDHGEFDGFRVPTRVDGGNHFGTDAYFPFFKATVVSISFQ